MRKIAKAIAAAITGAIVTQLPQFGIEAPPEAVVTWSENMVANIIQMGLGALIPGFFTWLIPNSR